MTKKRRKELEEKANVQITIAGAKTAICNLIWDKEHTFKEGIIEYALVNKNNLSSEDMVCLIMGMGMMDEEDLNSCPEYIISDEIIWYFAEHECTKEHQEIILKKLDLEEVK